MNVIDMVKHITSDETDADLARRLDLSPVTISNIRSGRLSIGMSFLVRLHEATGVGTKELRDVLQLDIRGLS